MADLAKEWKSATPVDLTKEWEGATPLTAEWEAAAPLVKPRSYGVSGEWEPADFLESPPGETQLSQGKPIRKAASNIYTPALEMAGMMAGPAGFAAARYTARGLDEFTGLNEGQPPITEQLKRVGTDVLIGGALKAGGKLIEKAVSPIVEPYVNSAAKKLSDTIRGGIEKGIRPTVKGKASSPELERYLVKAESGVKSIISNKNNLQLSDKKGNIVTGKLPKSLKQFSESIDQTKKWIFDQYDELQKTTGVTGVKIDLAPIVDDLLKLADNEVLATEAPNIVRFARMKARQYAKQGAYSPSQAQEAIKTINERLRAAYAANDVKVTQTKSIEDFAVTRLRAGLDDAIEKTTGNASYQELKNAYGSLRSIEKDVAHRSVVDARKNKVGFFGYADIWTAAEVVAAITNPAHLPKAIAIQGTKRWIMWYNNPNRIIKSMFGGAEKYMSKLPKNVRAEVIDNTPLKVVEREIYRYNPEFIGVKSPRPKPLKTELQAGAGRSEIQPKEVLLPDQRARAAAGKVQAADSKIGPPLIKPKPSNAKSPKPMSVADRLKSKIPMGKYKKAMDVREAFGRGDISEKDAEYILKTKFGFEE